MDLERERRDIRNAKARARYAAMDSVKKSAFLAARRARRLCSVTVDMEGGQPSDMSLGNSAVVINSVGSSSFEQPCSSAVVALASNILLDSVESASTSTTSVGDPPLSRMVSSAQSDLRAVHNQKKRARYASMDCIAKEAFLRRKSARRDFCSSFALSLSQSTAAACPLNSDTSLSVHDNILGSTSISRSAPQRFAKLKDLPLTPWSLPDESPCHFCEAFRFHRETAGFCCGSGQISLAKTVFCPIMCYLFTDPVSEVAGEFRRRSRSYNNGFAFTSIGMSFDPNSWWAREGVYALKVFGQVSHYVNPIDGNPDKVSLLQLFFLDAVDQLDAELLKRKDLNPEVLALLIQALSDNPYTKFFNRLKSWDNLDEAHVVIKTSPALDQRNCNVPTVDEVAAVWRDGDEAALGSERDIRVYTCGGRRHRVNYYYSCYDPMQYPALFPKGEPGWHPGIKKNIDVARSNSKRPTPQPVNEVVCDPHTAHSGEGILLAEERAFQENKKARNNISCREYYCYKMQMRPRDSSYLVHSGRLGHQFIIDMYIKLETSRLDYYKSDQFQREVRIESFQGIIDSIHVDGETDPSQIGQKVILPSSFIGGPRDMRKRYVNAMALVQRFGKPDLFFTMTCNPGWKEIQAHLLPFQKPHDRPDLIARVFKAKLEELKDDLIRKKIFGEVAAYVYVVEYQKRGLPHAHWIIILTAPNKIVCPSTYDHIISAEIPGSDHPFLREYVVKHMMHGPCGSSNMKSSCMRNGVCKYRYPKDFVEVTANGYNSYPMYRRRNKGMSFMIRNCRLDNRHVIPYSPYLLAKFDCHINVEIVTDVRLVKYLYKYVYKGHDRSGFNVVGRTSTNKYDEIQAYQEGRYICAPEACWRMYGFPMSEIYPAVIVLPVHLPNHQPLRFGLEQALDQVLRNPLAGKTMLTEFFSMNATDLDAKRLKLHYKDFPEHFVWEGTKRKWKIRQKQVVIGRLCSVSPMEGERYFERLLLVNVRCPSSFDDLKTVGGTTYITFREAAVRRGLLQSDQYIDACLAEAASFQMPYCLRVLFAMLLVYGITADPQVLWDKYYLSMSEDFLRTGGLTDAQLLCKTVDAVELVLTSMDKTILDFPIKFGFEYPLVRSRTSKDYEHECSLVVSEEDVLSINCLNTEQLWAYRMVLQRVNHRKPGVFFLDGPGGTGKTYLYRALLAKIRSAGSIALAVASSGVAASLLPGGRTAHSRFKLPIDLDDKPMGKISKQGSSAKMIVEARLIIWDEASMANRHSIEALDNLLQDLCGNKLLFGGKVILFGGDFRQTLPIIVHGTQEDMIGASIVSSKIWQHVIRLHLTENMRAREDPEFIKFLLDLGDGRIPFIFDDNIRIPSPMIIPFVDTTSSLDALINYVYPSMDVFVTDPYYLVNRAILTTKNDVVDQINDLLMDRFPGEVKEYVSFNTTNDATQQSEYEDYLNSVSASGLPPHVLKLKKNCPIMLLRNINPVQGLCNGTRLICRELGDNFIKAEICVGDLKGTQVFIPRIPLETSDKYKCPISFKRLQIPVRPCFAMTINKAQGQTLDMVGVYLREPVFSHGQLYVGLSRVRTSMAIKILIHPDFKKEGTVDYTRNIVYQDIFLLAECVSIFLFLHLLYDCIFGPIFLSIYSAYPVKCLII